MSVRRKPLRQRRFQRIVETRPGKITRGLFFSTAPASRRIPTICFTDLHQEIKETSDEIESLVPYNAGGKSRLFSSRSLSLSKDN